MIWTKNLLASQDVKLCNSSAPSENNTPQVVEKRINSKRLKALKDFKAVLSTLSEDVDSTSGIARKAGINASAVMEIQQVLSILNERAIFVYPCTKSEVMIKICKVSDSPLNFRKEHYIEPRQLKPKHDKPVEEFDSRPKTEIELVNNQS